jgi:hypothetical protein
LTASDYFVDKRLVEVLEISNVPTYSNYKGRITTPLFVTHGARTNYKLNINGYAFDYSVYMYYLTQSCLTTIFEILNSGVENYKMVSCLAFGGKGNVDAQGMANLIKIPTSTTGKATLYHGSYLMPTGTIFELWGKNE